MLRALAVSLVTLAVIVGPCVSAHAADGAPAATEAAAAATGPALTPSALCQQPSPNSLPLASGEDSVAEASLLELINQRRQEAGASPVRMEESLRRAALLHAQLMVSNHGLEHQFPGESPLIHRVSDVSDLSLDRAAENIVDATCTRSADATLMHSPPHRANLLDARFNVVGVAAVWTQGRLYVVQDFGHALPKNSVQDTAILVARAVRELRASAGLAELEEFAPENLDEAACEMAKGDHPAAHTIASGYTNRKVITYTQSRPEILPNSAQSVLKSPDVRSFAVCSCYARSATHPSGVYWVAILLE